jgi:hypothetical protein
MSIFHIIRVSIERKKRQKYRIFQHRKEKKYKKIGILKIKICYHNHSIIIKSNKYSTYINKLYIFIYYIIYSVTICHLLRRVRCSLLTVYTNMLKYDVVLSVKYQSFIKKTMYNVTHVILLHT